MLILENVCKTYSTGFPALNNISLRVEKGEFVFIVGQSGAGKSTLIKLLLKELEPTSGHIFINGKNLGRAKRRELPLIRRDMGVVFQDFRLLEDRNIYDNRSTEQKNSFRSPVYVVDGGTAGEIQEFPFTAFGW